MRFKKYTVYKKINDKHFEVVIRQMMRKVRVQDPGDTLFLEDQLIHTKDFIFQNDKLYGMKVLRMLVIQLTKRRSNCFPVNYVMKIHY
jgi:hypothetical protein